MGKNVALFWSYFLLVLINLILSLIAFKIKKVGGLSFHGKSELLFDWFKISLFPIIPGIYFFSKIILPYIVKKLIIYPLVKILN